MAGCPAMRTPNPRSCCTIRQTPERLTSNSCATLLPLTTTVAWSLSSRTRRERLRSVRFASDAARVFALAGMRHYARAAAAEQMLRLFLVRGFDIDLYFHIVA